MEMHWQKVLLALILGLVIALGFRLFRANSSNGIPYPPGPPSKSWITGNLSDIPRQCQWVDFTEWARQYGGLVYFRALHVQNILVSDLEVASDLFEKQSIVYSSRPHIPIVELMGWTNLSLLMPYSTEWHAHNRIFQQAFKVEASRKYQPVQTQKINDMLYELLTAPESFVNHIRCAPGAMIMSTVYGHNVIPKNDTYTDTAETATENLAVALLSGTFLVNIIPILRYIPAWFPGAGFQRFAQENRLLVDKMFNAPLDMVRKRMESSNSHPCLASELLESCQSEEELKTLTGVCGTAYAGGADTPVSAVETFFYAMAKFPDIQKKAQEEIDKVVGQDQLPTFEDRDLLPYVEALCREILRWRPVIPISIPRYMEREDFYRGYRIPKGSNVIPNIWAMTRDPTRYDDPEAFNPSRFIKADGTLDDDNMTYAFGFGRRLCPGRHFAMATVWLSVASVLAVFNIGKKKDPQGRDIPIESGYNSSFVLHPLPFECSITPRSETAKALIIDAYQHA